MRAANVETKYGLIINGIKITNHFIDRFIERSGMSNTRDNEGQMRKIINAALSSADCLFPWRNGAQALRTDFGIVVLAGKSVAVTFLEWSYLNKSQKKQIKGLPQNFALAMA